MVSVGVLRAEGCDETVDLGLIGGRELEGEVGPSEGREQLEACASKLPYGREMDHPVRPQALEQPVQRSWTDVVQGREHGHSPEGDAVELEGLVRSLGMSGELPGPGRSSSHHDDAVGRGRFRPQPWPQLLAGWSGHACSEVGRAAEDQIGDLLGGAGLHPLAHVLVALGGDQDAGVTQPFRHHPNIDPGDQGERGPGMPQIM